MKRIVLLALAAGCSSHLWTLPPPQPTLADVAAGCRFEDTLGADGKPLPFMARVSCPALNGIELRAVEYTAVRYAAPVGPLLERELMLVSPDVALTAGRLGVVVYFAADASDSLVVTTKDDKRIRRMLVSAVLSPGELGFMRTRAEIMKEDRTYAVCKAFLLDVPTAAADPARSEACSRLMVVIDRNRSMRQAEAHQTEAVALGQARIEAENRSARALEAANSQRAMSNLSEAIRRMSERPAIQIAPLPRAVVTDCQTYGRNTNCVTH